MILFLDAGHGGLSPQGTYTTFPDKCFRHDKGNFHNGLWFYEGVSNRNIAEMLYLKLTPALKNVKVLKTYHPYKDTPLKTRTLFANTEYQKRKERALFLSLHSDASIGHNASGFTVYTSPGQTQSDPIGTIIFDNVKEEFGKEIKYRTDTSDKDHDKEERFHVLHKTVMPSVLLEWLFFDHYKDAQKIIDPVYMNRYCNALFNSIKEIL